MAAAEAYRASHSFDSGTHANAWWQLDDYGRLYCMGQAAAIPIQGIKQGPMRLLKHCYLGLYSVHAQGDWITCFLAEPIFIVFSTWPSVLLPWSGWSIQDAMRGKVGGTASLPSVDWDVLISPSFCIWLITSNLWLISDWFLTNFLQISKNLILQTLTNFELIFD